jgi:hypothetical protein
MIVKNESHIIEKTLQNMLSYIPFDYYVISDTGSSDNTIDLIKNFFNSKNIKGEIYSDIWKDFGYNRTLALKHAYNKSDYLFIFDADDKIIGNLALPRKLNEDAYYLKFGGGCGYKRILLIKNSYEWKYVGVLHEYISCVTKNNHSCEMIEGNYYIESGKIGSRSNDPDKYNKDAIILENAYNECIKNNDKLYVRYSFYCAQSYRDSNQNEKAIEWYKKRISHNDWTQEIYFSYFSIGILYMKLNEPEKAIYYWSLAFDTDDRYECIYEIITYFRKNNKPLLAYQYYKMIKNLNIDSGNKLFLINQVYDYLLDYELSIIAMYNNEYQIGINSFNKLFLKNNIDINIQVSVLNNFIFYINHIKFDINLLENYCNFVKNIYYKIKRFDNNQYASINKTINHFSKFFNENDILNNIKSKLNNKDSVNVFLSITSCKRYDLFTKTVNSFLTCCKDINKIDYFFCIDDNSSHEDRKNMLKNYSFFKYYFKKEDEKGHLSSMNIIWNKLNELKPEYWIHLEDDWLFFKPFNYVSESIEFLNKHKKNNIHQILFNKNYGEIINDYELVGGSIINNNLNYLLHIKDEVIENGRNCAYWPHYSFRPSMILTSTILKLGDYTSINTFFERDYADKYYSNGYQSAFFNEITSIHIGKLTSDKISMNAYKLNEISQFNSDNKTISNEDNKSLFESINNITINNSLYLLTEKNIKINYIRINEKYIYLQNFDHFGDDLQYNDNFKIEDLINITENNENIICFNNLGYLKNNIDLNNLMIFNNNNFGLFINIDRIKKYHDIQFLN